jgi:ankyrin repeat protein
VNVITFACEKQNITLLRTLLTNDAHKMSNNIQPSKQWKALIPKLMLIACRSGFLAGFVMMVDEFHFPISGTSVIEGSDNNGGENGENRKEEEKEKEGRTQMGERSSYLHIACEEGRYDIVHALLSRGAYVSAMNTQQGEEGGGEGMQPIHMTCKRNAVTVMNVLLDFGADIDARTIEGMNTLHLACISGNRELVQFLLTKSRNRNLLLSYMHNSTSIINAKCNLGLTPLDYAKRNHSSHIHKQIVSDFYYELYVLPAIEGMKYILLCFSAYIVMYSCRLVYNVIDFVIHFGHHYLFAS